MKKMLKRLKKEARSEINEFLDTDLRLMKNLSQAGHKLALRGIDAITACIRYIEALEDYGYELDEEWDKLLKTIQEAQQGKPVQKEAKKTTYIK